MPSSPPVAVHPAATLLTVVRASRGGTEFHEYAVSGHLFTDASRPDEFDSEATEMLWNHVHDFLRKLPG